MTFYPWCSAWVRWALLLVTCLALAACGPPVPTALAPHIVAGVKSTHVTSYIPEARVKVLSSELNLSGGVPTFPLNVFFVSLAIDAGVNSARESEAAERAAKFVDVDFRGQFWAAISPVVKETAWLKAGQLQTSTMPKKLVTAPTNARGARPRAGQRKPSTMPKKPVTAATNARAGELVINTAYFITPEARNLVVATGLQFYPQGQGETQAAVDYISYSSAAIGIQEGDEAIKLWTADQGAAYKNAAPESVAESAKMLRYALRRMGGDSPKPQRQLRLKFKKYMAWIVEVPSIEVSIVEETEERILYQTESGTFYSVAAEDIDFDGQPSLYAEKERRAEEKTERGQSWKKWGTEHPGDPCVSAFASLKSASECVGAACRMPLILMAGYERNCQRNPETRIEMHRLRRKWEKEAGAGTSK